MDLTPYATVTGGTALVHNGKDSAVDIFYSDNININGSSKSYVKLSLSTPLKEGDVITFTLGDGATDTFYLTTTSSNSNCSVNNGTYTVTSSDGLASSTELYIWKNSGGKFKSITITRSGSSTETTGYIVTATADNGTGTVTITDNSGNIIESGSQVNSGTSLTFTATPNEGYEFSSWTVTGTTGTADGATYTIASLTEATSVTANFKTGSSVIYFTGSGTTTSNTDVLSATGYMKSKPGEITYKEKQYSNALKMESSTSVTLKLSSESDVVLVFNPSNSGKTIIVDGKEYTINTNGLVTITSLAVGEHTIARGDDETHLYAVDIQPTGPSITISTQPKSADYATGATTVDPLTVEATLDGYTLSYQWYQNTTNSNTGGTAISGETAKSYTPTLSSTAGTTYYYCVVTAEKEGSKTLTATSDVAVITVSDPYIKFTTQPTSGSYAQGDTPSDLTVVAATNLGEPTYQWYYKSSETAEFKEITTDATSASYTPSTSTAGTTYYYCVATAKKDGITKTATSNTVSVTVASATYSYKVNETGINAPDINTSLYITDKNKTKLVKMTFGGWKWNEGKYSINRKEIGEGTTDYTDSWKPSDQEPDVAPIDNHNYWFSGTNDAVDESKAVSEQVIYGKKRYGWFKTKTTNTAGKVTTYPFTLPVRGSFMTFEPTMNGTLSIYILQNGAWNTNRAGKYTDTDGDGTIDFNNGDIVAGEFRPHAFYVTNQRGLTVQEFSPKYSVETKQTVTSDYYCMFTTDDDYTEEKYNDPHNVARWTEFAAYMSVDEQQRCHDNWKNGENGAQTIIELDNGSFLAVQKGIVKYTFHVTGNETYYFFSNFSKMGFSGARFTPDGDDAQPIETLSLSDTKEYTVPTAGTDAVVGNVTIPQYESITLDRTFKAGQWTTLTLPFNLTQDEVQSIFGAGTQIIMLDKATLSSDGGARLHFIYHEIQNVLPGYPYLIKPTLTNITNDANVSVTKADNNTALTSFTVYGKCINPSIDPFKVVTDPYTFMGTPGYCTADLTNNSGKSGYSVHYKANDIFVSEGDGKLYVSGDSSYGKGYRAWLKNNKSGTNAVKSISVVMSSFSDDDDTTTSIDVAEMAPDLIEALGIQTGVYNLSGQRVANDTRNLKAGIYIVNGKKTVVR